MADTKEQKPEQKPAAKLLSAKELKLGAVGHALSGGRIYGALQHRLAFEWLADQLVKGSCDAKAFSETCGDIGNLSQLQQALDKAGKIDRNSKAAAKASIWDDLSA